MTDDHDDYTEAVEGIGGRPVPDLVGVCGHRRQPPRGSLLRPRPGGRRELAENDE